MKQKIFIIIIGLIFVIAGIFAISYCITTTKNCSIETSARVVDIIERVDTDDDFNETYTYYPVIEYTVNDQTIKDESNIGQGSLKYHIGDKIDIKYNPDNIYEYIIVGDNTIILIGSISLILGLIATCLGILKKD